MGERSTYNARPTILVVDDAPENLALMSSLLKERYRVKLARNGETALQLASTEPGPDLILLDVMMPGIDGYEVLARLRATVATRDIPVIFLTARAREEDEQRGLDLGAEDYITKPIRPSILLSRVHNHLLLKSAKDFLRNHNAYLEAEVVRRTEELAAIQDVTILAMASLAETRDNETGNHIRRTQHFVRALAEQLKTHPSFAAYLTDTTIELLFKSAPLHDIGKVGIPDRILLKPSRHTPEEFEIMKRHPTLGKEAIEAAEQALGTPVAFLTLAKEIAFSHQEKWDGSGYPLGLIGEAIPISARLMAVADVYDALTSRRAYKEAMSHETALGIIAEGRGKHFDPDMVDAFLQVADTFQMIAQRYLDFNHDLLAKRASFAL